RLGKRLLDVLARGAVQEESFLRPEALPWLFAPGDAAVIVEAAGGGHHGAAEIGLAEQGGVGPQGRADKANATNNGAVILQKMCAIGCRYLTGARQFLVEAAPLVLMITHHHDARDLRRHE